jgi:hypothetical protein
MSLKLLEAILMVGGRNACQLKSKKKGVVINTSSYEFHAHIHQVGLLAELLITMRLWGNMKKSKMNDEEDNMVNNV